MINMFFIVCHSLHFSYFTYINNVFNLRSYCENIRKSIYFQQKGVKPMYTDINISMDSDVKEKADALFSELGMDLSTAFNLFVRESLRVGGIPFELTPNKETIEAMEEAKRMTYDSSVKGYDNLDELFEELKS